MIQEGAAMESLCRVLCPPRIWPPAQNTGRSSYGLHLGLPGFPYRLDGKHWKQCGKVCGLEARSSGCVSQLLQTAPSRSALDLGFIPKGSNVVLFGQYISIPKKHVDHNPKKELHWSLWVYFRPQKIHLADRLGALWLGPGSLRPGFPEELEASISLDENLGASCYTYTYIYIYVDYCLQAP